MPHKNAIEVSTMELWDVYNKIEHDSINSVDQ